MHPGWTGGSHSSIGRISNGLPSESAQEVGTNVIGRLAVRGSEGSRCQRAKCGKGDQREHFRVVSGKEVNDRDVDYRG